MESIGVETFVPNFQGFVRIFDKLKFLEWSYTLSFHTTDVVCEQSFWCCLKSLQIEAQHHILEKTHSVLTYIGEYRQILYEPF